MNKEQRESYLVDVLILRKRGMGVEAISAALGVHKRQGKRWADMLRARGQWPALSDGQITELCRREVDERGQFAATPRPEFSEAHARAVVSCRDDLRPKKLFGTRGSQWPVYGARSSSVPD